jgi:hypothetical protein
MRIKSDVSLHGLQPEMQPILRIVWQLEKELDLELVISSGTEYIRWDEPEETKSFPLIHLPHSWHHFGLAIDFSTKGINDLDKQKIYLNLADRAHCISPHYDIVKEENHIHVEYDLQKYWSHNPFGYYDFSLYPGKET